MHFPSTKGIAARAATAALGFALVLSQVPAAALAEAAGIADAQAQAQQTAEAAPDAATTQGEPAAAPASEGEASSAAGSTSATPAAPDAATASAVASVAAATAATPAAATSSAKAAPAVATVAPEVARIVSASGSQVRYDTVVAPGAKLTVNAYTTEEDDWGDEDEVPVDTSAYAGYAFQWYRGTVVSYGTKFDSYRPIAGATSRSYTVVDADADSYLACKISFTRADGSHGELWSDSSTGKVTDGRATLDSAKVAGTAKEGQTLSASAYVANGWGGMTEADSSSFVAWQWQQASASAGTYVDIAGATKSTLTLTDALVGRFLRVRASSRNNVTSAAVGPVIARGTQRDEELLAQAVKALESSGYAPSPVYGTDANVNDMVHARLVSLGEKYADVQVVTESVERTAEADPSQRGGISCDAADNGQVTFFSLSPAKKTVNTSTTTLRQLRPTFRLKYGTATAWYTPSKYVLLDWDQKAMSAELDATADSLAPAYATGDSADSVTQKFALPNKLGTGVSVSWKSSDDSALGLSGYSWDDQTTATPSRGTQDRHVTLTATVSFSGSDAPSGSVTRTFDVTVKGDPGLVERELAMVRQKLDDNFTLDSLSYISSADGDFDPQAVVGDIQLPTTSKLGVRRLDFDVKVSYSASNQTLSVNGYRANVLRPVEGASDASVGITCTVALKDDPTQSVSKTLTVRVKPLESSAIDSEVALLDRVSQQFGTRLLGGQDANAVTGDLKPFREAYEDASGSLTWADSASEADGVHGIVATELAGYDPMGPSDQGRTFGSSNSSVVSNETLRVTKPKYNTKVKISANLASEKYGAYYARYKDDAGVSAELKAKLARLAGTPVSMTVTVGGTTGQDAPLQVTGTVIGPDAFGQTETWATSSVELAGGSTVWDLSQSLFKAAGLTYDAQDSSYGVYLNTITSPTTGKAYGYDQATGRYWQLFVNGEAASEGAGSIKLSDGDSVVWYYSAYGDKLPASDQTNVTASVKVVGPNAQGASTSWVSQTEASVTAGTTAAQLTKAILERNNMTCDDAVGTISAASGVLPNGQASLGYWQDADGNWYWWQFYVNGELSNEYAASYVVQPGDRIEWFFGRYGEDLPSQDVTIAPDATRPDYTAEWGAYKGTDGTGASTADTATTGSTLLWQQNLGTDGMTFQSDPIIVNGDVYIAVGNTLQVRDAATGKILRQAALAERVESTCRIAYANGIVVVPLHDGRVQALTADNLQTVWLTDALPQSQGVAQQSIATPLVSNGYLYLGTDAPKAGFEGGSLGGYLLAVSLRDGSVRWQYQNPGSGYYWSGAQSTVAGILVADDAGSLTLHDASTGKVLASLSLGTSSRAGIVVAEGGTVAYVVTKDGVLHRVRVSADGTLTPDGTCKFDNYSTSTPTLSNGKIYVGGGSASMGGVGSINVIDAATLALQSHVTTTSAGDDDGAIPGDVKSSPLVVAKADGTYAYFTSNGTPGGVFMYKLGQKNVTLLYSPQKGQQNYNMASVVAAADGSLYFVNDSGYLFKIGSQSVGGTLPDQATGKSVNQKDQKGEKGEKDGNAGTTSGGGKNASSGSGATGGGSGSGSAGSTSAGSRAGSGKAAQGSGKAGAVSTSKTVAGKASPADGGKSAASGPLALLRDVASDVLTVTTEDRTSASVGTGVAAGTAHGGSAKASAGQGSLGTGGLPIWPIVGMALGAAAFVAAVLRRRNDGDKTDAGAR
ncbi:DUF4430 domain-containing protein [Parafannyhessea umbonata]|uniref:DUF4430 domain-containing protein n=1 Tax=Parafannyhessea umbonata TaxID=604330 RepID=A0A6N7WUL2_9ACTN|nr:DUF4430 domain-containing protein [Parafannyhessea umbonata]MST59751.1 DUF4430 domain-containing protein [Parafannyhessea umbonata]